MKHLSVTARVTVAALVVGLSGCNKGRVTDATKPLEQAFAGSNPREDEAIQMVCSNFNAGEYLKAAKILDPIVEGRKLTAEQKRAVALALKQINEATVNNTNLDSSEMYQVRDKLFRAAYRN
jgi:hypothetical protein